MGVNRKNSGYKFTKYKSYEILGWFGRSAEVLDDDGKRCFVAVGAPTMRLDDGQFVKVNFPHAQEAVEYAQRTAAQSIRDLSKDSGWHYSKIGQVTISDGQIYESASPRNEYAEVLEKLREILRVPEGENILTHAKVVRVLADGLINLQK